MNKIDNAIIGKIASYNVIGDTAKLFSVCKYFNRIRNDTLKHIEHGIITPIMNIRQFVNTFTSIKHIVVKRILTDDDLVWLSSIHIESLTLLYDPITGGKNIQLPHLTYLSVPSLEFILDVECPNLRILEFIERCDVANLPETYIKHITASKITDLRGPLLYVRGEPILPYTRLTIRGISRSILKDIRRLQLTELCINIHSSDQIIQLNTLLKSSCCRNISRLTISNDISHYADYGTSTLNDFFLDCGLPNVKYLKLVGNIGFGYINLLVLPNLEELHLDGCCYDGNGDYNFYDDNVTVSRLIKGYIGRLKTLNVRNITNEPECEWYKALQYTSIESLTVIERGKLTSYNWLSYLPDCLAYLKIEFNMNCVHKLILPTCLRTLMLRNYVVGEQFIDNIVEHGKIRYLSLKSCYVGDRHLSKLANMKLDHLDLSGNLISFMGLRVFKKTNAPKIVCDTLNLAECLLLD